LLCKQKTVKWGEAKNIMSGFVWHWVDGDKKIYTRREDIAEKALKEGKLVIGIKISSLVFSRN